MNSENEKGTVDELIESMKRASINADFKQKVTLNIGGVLFTTYKETLLKYDSKIKKKILEENYRGYDNIAFFDRDPKHFRLILNYFRDGEIIYPKNGNHIQELQNEIKFYEITSLLEKYSKIEKSSDIIQKKVEKEEKDEKIIKINKPFEFTDYFDKNGMIYYLGTSSSSSFTNPFDQKLISIFTPNGYYPLLGDLCCQSTGLDCLKSIFDYEENLKKNRSISLFSYFAFRFSSHKIKMNEFTLGNTYSGSLESFLPDNLEVFGLNSLEDEEINDSNMNLKKLDCSLVKKSGKIKHYKIKDPLFFNSYLIKNPFKKMLVISAIEIYGELN